MANSARGERLRSCGSNVNGCSPSVRTCQAGQAGARGHVEICFAARAFVALAAALGACSSPPPAAPATNTPPLSVQPARDAPPPALPAREITTLGLGDTVYGLSGLAAGEHGSLWTVTEKLRTLVEIPATGAPRTIAVSGVPGGLELESVAWLGGGQLAAGTEGDCTGNQSRILVIDIGDIGEGGRAERTTPATARTGARVSDQLMVSHDLWGVGCHHNRALEGLCSAGQWLVASIEEPTADAGGRRMAALVVIDIATRAATPFLVPLTSDTGRLSALDCRLSSEHGDRIEVVAVERHFEVSRLLRVMVPTAAQSAEPARAPTILDSTMVMDLMPYTDDRRRNFEGVVLIGDHEIILVADNHYGKVTGPNELVRLVLP